MQQWNGSVSFDSLADIFEEIPLKQLSFTYTQFLSLPPTLEYLEIGKANFDTADTSITPDSWSAICALERLETLNMFCRFDDWRYPHSPCFKSSKLTHLEATIHYAQEVWRVEPAFQGAIKNVIQPILEDCLDLERIKVKVFDAENQLRREDNKRNKEDRLDTKLYSRWSR